MELAQPDSISELQLQGSRLYTVSISIVVALGATMFGFDVAIISGAVPFIQHYFALSELQLGWGVSSLIIGCMAGALCAGHAADKFGRRRILLCVALVFTITSIATALAPNFSLFVLARIVGGIAVGAASTIVPLYIAEVSPYSVRGRMVSLNQLGITFGILISYLINYLLCNVGHADWRWMFATGAVPSVTFFILLFFVPESPRWLQRIGREDDALAILTRIGGIDNAKKELSAMFGQIDRRTATLKDMFCPCYRHVIFVGALLAILVQVSGINTVIEYAPVILHSAGNVLDTALFQTFIIGIINFVFTFIAVLTVDNIGRKPLYISGACGMTICLMLLSAVFVSGHAHGVLGLICILLFIAFFSGCIGPVYWILTSEIFPSRIRGLAMSVAVFLCWASNFLVALLFPWVLTSFGGAATFAALAIVAAAMAFVGWKLVPETKGQTLEEVDYYWERYTH